MAFFEEWADLHRHREATFWCAIGLHVDETHIIQESLLLAKPLSTLAHINAAPTWLDSYTEKKMKMNERRPFPTTQLSHSASRCRSWW